MNIFNMPYLPNNPSQICRFGVAEDLDFAMPYNAIIHLLKGGEITIFDSADCHGSYGFSGTDGGRLSYALSQHVPAWMEIFNDAIAAYPSRWTVAEWLWDRFEYDNPLEAKVCDWEFQSMPAQVGGKLMKMIHGLAKIYGRKGPCIVGANVRLVTTQRRMK